MKHLFIVCAFLFSAFTVSAQATLDVPTDRSAYMGFYAKQLNLNVTQIQKMGVIFDNKQRNLASIESLKTSDPSLYKIKLSSVSKGAEGSVFLMISGQQKTNYDAYKRARRSFKYEKSKQVSVSGGSKEAVAAIQAEGDF